MPNVNVIFREMARPGAGSMVDRFDEHALSAYEAALAKDCQVTRGVLEKSPGWMRLTGLSPSGNSLSLDGTVAEGASFPDHAQYDLGKRWTIHAAIQPADITGTLPVYWRADGSNNKITTLELVSGVPTFTHRDANDAETVLTSPHTLANADVAGIRVQRYKNELRMFVGLSSGYWQSVTDTSVDADYDTKPSATKFYVGVSTDSDGDTVAGEATFNGLIDEVRMFRDELRDGDPFVLTEYPWLADERMVLCARLNDDAAVDLSALGNDGTILGSEATDGAAVVTAMAPILAEWHLRLSDGTEKWMVWSNGGIYGVAVQ